MIKGIHHISLKCNKEEADKVKEFYVDILGLKLVRTWKDGMMIDTGNGLIEIFTTGGGIKETGAVCHFALETDDVDEMAAKVKSAGYEVFKGPDDRVIPSTPEFPLRMAFCYGPLGEEVEFFKER